MDARNLIKRILHPILKPAADWYLSRDRKYRYKGIEVNVKPNVFHPGFLISTKILLAYLEKQSLRGKSFLELGAGSGLISIFAAKRGAMVTASDISLAAIENICENAENHKLDIEVITSDLFDAFPDNTYDWIVINPPYYPKSPENEKEFAWYCGPNFEYFHKLFDQMGAFVHHNSKVIMILSEDCEIERIREIAEFYGWRFALEEQVRNMGEENFVFGIRK